MEYQIIYSVPDYKSYSVILTVAVAAFEHFVFPSLMPNAIN
jgi:hypothetical protein